MTGAIWCGTCSGTEDLSIRPAKPGVDRLTADAVAANDVGDGRTVKDLSHRVVALFH
jgi:hypothetical protein